MAGLVILILLSFTFLFYRFEFLAFACDPDIITSNSREHCKYDFYDLTSYGFGSNKELRIAEFPPISADFSEAKPYSGYSHYQDVPTIASSGKETMQSSHVDYDKKSFAYKHPFQLLLKDTAKIHLSDTEDPLLQRDKQSQQFASGNDISRSIADETDIRNMNNMLQLSTLKKGQSLDDVVYVYEDGNNTIVYHDSKIISNNTNSAVAIQEGIRYASTTGDNEVFISGGRYEINQRLNFTNDLFFHGEGKNTVLDFSQLGEKNTISMATDSRLEDLLLTGSDDNLSSGILKKDFTQRIQAVSDVEIRHIWIYNLAYGIDAGGSEDVTITDIECINLKSKNDWAACVHASSGSKNIAIRSFRVENSNRAIEIEDGASGITVENGYLGNITNFNNSGHQAFSLDVHSHDGKGGVSDILFQNMYLNNSYAPTTIISSSNGEYDIDDLPRNIVYENVTLLNPQSSWQVNGDNVRISNSKIINSTHDIFAIGKNSRGIVLLNITAHPVHGESKHVVNTPEATGLRDVTIINNKITGSSDKIGPLISIHDVDGLNLRNNIINTAPSDSHPFDLSFLGVEDLSACGNLIRYVNGTRDVWESPC